MWIVRRNMDLQVERRAAENVFFKRRGDAPREDDVLQTIAPIKQPFARKHGQICRHLQFLQPQTAAKGVHGNFPQRHRQTQF